MKRAAVARLSVYVVLFLVLTGLFLLLNLPEERLAATVNKRIEAMAPGLLSVSGASLRPPMTLALSGVRARLSGQDVDVGTVELRPVLHTLFGKNRRVRGTASGSWGGGDFTLLLMKGSRGIEFDGVKVDLSALPVTGKLPITLAGYVNARERASFIPEGGGRIVGEGFFGSQEVVLAGGILTVVGAGEIRLAPVEVNWKAADNLMTLGEAEIGGDLIGNAKGTVRLAPADLGSSRLDIAVTLRPSAEAKDRLGSVMVAAGGGDYDRQGGAPLQLRRAGAAGEQSVRAVREL